jgi:hypothetical protein
VCGVVLVAVAAAAAAAAAALENASIRTADLSFSQAGSCCSGGGEVIVAAVVGKRINPHSRLPFKRFEFLGLLLQMVANETIRPTGGTTL